MTVLRALTTVALVIVSALVPRAPVLAQIRTVQSLREVLPSLGKGVLLVVDLDNTVMEPTGSLGSDQWFYHLLKRYQERERLAPREAQQKAVRVWNEVQWLIRVRPVEPALPALLRAAQDRGVATLGLTARDAAISARTAQQLASIGVDLERAAPLRGELRRAGIRYSSGVLYAGEGQDKGELLHRFLRDHARARPARIAFIDDKDYNVRDVERALRKHGRPAELFRYAAADARVEGFRQDVSDLALFADGVLGPRALEAIRRARGQAR